VIGNSVGLEEVKRAEEFIRRRMGLRITVNAKQILEEALIQVHAWRYEEYNLF
jgi:hypothetical protein